MFRPGNPKASVPPNLAQWESDTAVQHFTYRQNVILPHFSKKTNRHRRDDIDLILVQEHNSLNSNALVQTLSHRTPKTTLCKLRNLCNSIQSQRTLCNGAIQSCAFSAIQTSLCTYQHSSPRGLLVGFIHKNELSIPQPSIRYTSIGIGNPVPSLQTNQPWDSPLKPPTTNHPSLPSASTQSTIQHTKEPGSTPPATASNTP